MQVISSLCKSFISYVQVIFMSLKVNSSQLKPVQASSSLCKLGWLRISKMRYCYQTWQIHILLENEMLKNVNFIKIGPRLDMPIGRQSFATNTPMWNGATNKN